VPAVSPNGSGPANLATIRAAVIEALKDDGYLHIPEGRRDHTTPAETLRLHGLDQDTSGHSPNTSEPWQNEAGHCLDCRSTYLLPYIRNLASFVNVEQQWQLNAVK